VLGLEVVLPDGRIWNGLRKLRKNNMGYDLKQLILGSEGTLGIVTAACLKLFPKPNQIETAFLAVESAEAAVALFGRARRDLSDLSQPSNFCRDAAWNYRSTSCPACAIRWAIPRPITF
jgi:FAD/FMN-containing dehydrogenase